MKKNNINQIERQYLTSKKVFIVTLIVILLTITAIWLFELGQHRTLFQNSLLSTTILSVAFFLFLTISLYKGVKLKDNLGKITDKINTKNIPDLSWLDLSGIGDISIGEGEIVIGILVWILVSIIFVFLIWFFGSILLILVLVFSAMLYWVFFRALRLVFKNSNRCKNNITKSICYGLIYTVLYVSWIYGIILTSHYLVK